MSIIVVIGGCTIMAAIYEAVIQCKNHIVNHYNRLKFRMKLRNRRNRHYILVVEEK